MKKSILIFILVLIIVIAIGAGAFFIFRNKLGRAVKPVEISGDQPVVSSWQSRKDLIQVGFPLPNDVVGSSLVVSGIARGTWFFEASFPVRVLDSQGKQLAVVPARAQGDWMTENFVPFIAVLDFEIGDLREGKIILERDNPSGLTAQAMSIEIPVKFDAGQTTVKVFFGRPIPGDMETECGKVVALGRNIAANPAMARAALEELFKGLTGREESLGYINSINPGVKIQSLNISGGLTKVDLSSELGQAVGGSCRVAAIRAQISETLKQFSTVESVVISIDGRTEDILQP